MMPSHGTSPTSPERVVLGLGSNQGHRLGYLRQGLFALACHPELRVAEISRVWETEYVGPGEQEPYLNLVCRGWATLAPAALLAVVKGLEQRLGRAPDGHMLPRTLDVDILIFGDRCGRDELLTLPHPRMAERGFVMAPLAELAPDQVLPDSGETAASTWARIRTEDGPWLRPLDEPLVTRDPGRDDEEEWRAALAVHCR